MSLETAFGFFHAQNPATTLRRFVPVVVAILIGPTALAEPDTLVFKNGDVMVGELKSMERGVAVVSTDYSDADFKILWIEVRRVSSTTTFFITTSDEQRYLGTLRSLANGRIRILVAGEDTVECAVEEIVYLHPVEATFLERLKATIEVGFSLAQANNLRQLSTRSSVGYGTQDWSGNLLLNAISSSQKGTESIRRTEGTLSYRRFLPARLYGIGTVSALTNTEQKLDLRLNSQLALGMFIFRNFTGHLGAEVGVNNNVERYSSETPNRTSWEGLIGAELNIYDIGDLRLVTTAIVYPSFTERGRWRVDSNLDLKYDLPLDFYIKFGGSINYDNRPAADASRIDYVTEFGLGWEW